MAIPTILTSQIFTDAGVLISDFFPAAGGAAGSGNNRVILYAISTKGNSSAESAVNACQCNGLNMTLAGSVQSAVGFNVRTTFYYLQEANLPVVPGPWTVVITTGGSQGVICNVFEIEEGETPEAYAGFGSNSNQTSWSNNITTLTADSLVFDAMNHDITTITDTPDGSQNSEGVGKVNNTSMAVSTLGVATPALTAMGWSWTNGSNRQSHSLVAVPPSGAVSSVPKNPIFLGMNF